MILIPFLIPGTASRTPMPPNRFMKTAAGSALLFLAFQCFAWAAQLKAGDRVLVTSINKYGTVESVDARGNISVKMDDYPANPAMMFFHSNVQLAGPDDPHPARISPKAPAPPAPQGPVPPAAAPLKPEQFKVGDRVFVTSIKEYGTVVSISAQGDPGVSLDKFPNAPDSDPLVTFRLNVQPAGPNDPHPTGVAHRPTQPPQTSAAVALKKGDRVLVTSINKKGTVESVAVNGDPTVRLDGAPDGYAPSFIKTSVQLLLGPDDPSAAPNTPALADPATPAGLQYPRASGLPPTGTYTAHKISGTHDILIGKMEINGTKYTGVAGGAAGKMKLNAANRINWTGGITGIDPGARVLDGVYQRPSQLTNFKHTIRIYYQNPNGATEVIDCTLE
jgi:hypothetical protein